MATSVLIRPVPPPHLQDGVDGYPQARNGVVGTATMKTRGQHAFQLEREVFESYLRSQGLSKDVTERASISGGNGAWKSFGKDVSVSVTAESSSTSPDSSSPLSSPSSFSFYQYQERGDFTSLPLPGSPSTSECLVCADPVSTFTSFRAPCGHHYCQPCLEIFVNASIKDESIFPPQCCRKNFPLGLLSPNEPIWPSNPSLSFSSSSSSSTVSSNLGTNLKLIHSLSEKFRECSVPAKDRIYCPVPQCSVFVGSLTTLRAYHHDSLLCLCHSCGMIICLGCTQSFHRGKKCTLPYSAESASATALAESQLKQLAKQKKWQTCPGCKSLVERSTGCHHMACRCGTQFCYGCGVDWKEGCRCGPEQMGLGVPLPPPGGRAPRRRRVGTGTVTRRRRPAGPQGSSESTSPNSGMSQMGSGSGPGPTRKRRRTSTTRVENMSL